MIYGEVFAGISGIGLGLERAGMQCAWRVEKDDYARRVLQRHWPDVRMFCDIRGVGAHNLQPVDLIAGGFPCQDISAAGKGEGITGERSGLWFEFARVIRELRPRYVLVENVPMLLHRGFGEVIGSLAACGYNAEWDCLPAAAFGAPHRRDRVFIVAYTSGHGREWWQHEQERESRSSHPTDSWSDGLQGIAANTSIEGSRELSVQQRQQGQESVDAHRSGQGNVSESYSEYDNNGRFRAGTIFKQESAPIPRPEYWPTEPGICGVSNGVPNRVDRLRCLGNAVLPPIAEYIGRLIMDLDREVSA